MILCKSCGECNWELVAASIFSEDGRPDLYQCQNCKRVAIIDGKMNPENCKQTDYV